MNIDENLKKPVVYRIPGMENASVVQNIVYREVIGEKLTLDVYYPAGYDSKTPLPAIIFIHGDAPWERLRTIKDSGQYTSWGQLVAASGMIGITFTHRSSEGFTDFQSPTDDI